LNKGSTFTTLAGESREKAETVEAERDCSLKIKTVRDCHT